MVDASPDRQLRRLAAVVVDGPTGQIRSSFLGADADTRWEIGSVSKALTGLLVADAIARGELTVDTTLAQLDPQYAGSVVGTATVRELTTHTSGLPPILTNPFAALGFTVFGLDPYQFTSVTRVARGARRRRLRTPSGYRYSNLGASVLGNAVAHQVGVDYAELLRARLAEPVGMAATTALRHDGPALPRGWRPDGRRSHPWRMPGYLPAGGVVSTAADTDDVDGGPSGRVVPRHGRSGHRAMRSSAVVPCHVRPSSGSWTRIRTVDAALRHLGPQGHHRQRYRRSRSLSGVREPRRRCWPRLQSQYVWHQTI